MAYTYPFRMASATATMLVIDPRNRKAVLGIRGDECWVFPSLPSLPGGFMEARFIDKPAKSWRERMHRWLTKILLPAPMAAPFHEGENLEQCAVRELNEELKTEFSEDQLHLFTVRSNPRTDTRAHVVNACYWLEATEEQMAQLGAGDDLKDIEIIDIDEFMHKLNSGEAFEREMAFNHLEILVQGLTHWEDYNYTRILVADAERRLRERIENDTDESIPSAKVFADLRARYEADLVKVGKDRGTPNG